MRKRPLRRAKRRRRLRRVLGGIAILCVGVVACREAIVERVVLPLLAPLLRAELGLDLEVARVEIGLLGRVRLLGIQACGDPSRSAFDRAHFEEVVAGLDYGAVFAGRLPVRRVFVRGGAIAFDLERSPLLPEPAEAAAGSTGDSPGPVELPEVKVEGLAVRLRRGGEELSARGISAWLRRDRDFRVAVASAEGNWSLPRLEALRLPLTLRGRLAAGDDPFELIGIQRVDLGGEAFAESLEVRPAPEGVQIRGRLPALGIRKALFEERRHTFRIEAELEGLILDSVLALISEQRSPVEGRLSGAVSLEVPPDRPLSSRVHADLAADRLAAPDLGIDARWCALKADGEGGTIAFETVTEGVLFRGRRLPDSLLRAALSRRMSELRFDVEELGLFPEAGALRGHFAWAVPAWGGSGDWELHLEAQALDARSLDGLARDGGGLPTASIDLDLALSGGPDPSGWEGAVLAEAGGAQEDCFSAALDLAAGIGPCLGIDGRGAVSLLDGALEAAFKARPAADPSRAGVDVIGGLASLRAEGVWMGVPFTVSARGEAESEVAALHAELEALGARGRAELRLREQGLVLNAVLSGLDPERALQSGLLPQLPPSAVELESGGAVALEAYAELPRGSWAPPLRLASEAVWGGGRLRFHEGGRDVFAGVQAVARGGELHLRECRVELAGAAVDVWGRVSNPSASPVPESSAGVDGGFRIEARRLEDLPYAQVLARRIGGSLLLDGRIEGRVGKPRLEARGRLAGGILKLPGEVPPLTDLLVAFEIAPDFTVRVGELTGRVGTSLFEGGGRLGLAPPWAAEGPGVRDLDIRVRARKALLLRRPDLRVRGDLDLRWFGPWERSTLAGRVRIVRAQYLRRVDLGIEQVRDRGVSLPFDLFHIEAPPLRDLRFDLRVEASKSLHVLNNVVRTRANADLRLAGTGLDPLLLGVISTDEGTVTFGNSKLRIRSALIEFQERDPYNPEIRAVLEETIRGYRVTVTVGGTLEDPQVVLESSPPLEREKLVVLITTGETVERIEERGVGEFAAVEAAKYVGRRVLEHLTRGSDPTEESFFDRFTLETESARRQYQEDLYRLEFLIKRGILLDRDELFLQGERDWYGDFNLNVGLRLELE